ncbi:MAG TPA: hypothetical protein VGC05_06705, partial [Mycobacterium sp.]
MADRLDVAQRLAEARVAVEHTQTYVRACQALGYANPELTSRPSQIRELFDSEDGLDLWALDSDCAELRAAGDAIAEGLRIQRAQAAELAAAWTGPGGEAADRFLQRHCDAANMVATEVRAAAQRCESLRDNLWYLLDSKVATTVAIDDRTQAQRAAWLAAAAEVSSGRGQGSTAEQVVGQQVMPYVDNDIRNDWLAAMRSSQANVGTSYDMVINRMAATPAIHFESPGDLGPGVPPLPAPPAPHASREASPVTAALTPAAVTVPTGGPANPVAAQGQIPVPSAAMPATPAPEVGSALGDTSAFPAGAGGLGGLGDMGAGSGLGGLGGLANRIVDAMTGLLGSAADGLSDPSGLDDSDGEDPVDDDDASDDHPFHPDDDHDDADDAHEGEAEAAQDVQPVDGPPPADVPPPIEASPPPP